MLKDIFLSLVTFKKKVLSVDKDHKDEVDPKDPKLPRELTDLFDALNCKLCEVLSSSTVHARHHYSGKPHEKKVRQWLQKWSEETGQPMPKRPKLDTVMTDVNPEDLFCRICEVTFTSIKHGEQHRMGKPHQKALRLGYCPNKLKTKKAETPFDPAGRFGIGEGFLKDNHSTEAIQPDAEQDGTVAPLGSKSAPINSKFYCDLCKISTTSQEHLDSHYVGAKHRKALVNAAKAGIKPDLSVIPPPVEPAASILASVISDRGSKGKTVVSDLSIYRTPSGKSPNCFFIITYLYIAFE
ncbi:hypothetical protein ONE63_011203 [Megalurothrips usitatus]|uniref:U1-type domain-containing protein n=1 Tax=Megalurothrips usitatus TaxID=439358 RepID=A0AAV7WZX7_9NEOP|nr:hypothetical protein ONE63_011203 [Megalurothrips usitatus]